MQDPRKSTCLEVISEGSSDRSVPRRAGGDLVERRSRTAHLGDLLRGGVVVIGGAVVIALLYCLVWCGVPIGLLQYPQALQVEGVPYAVPAAWAWWSLGALALLWVLGPDRGEL